MLPCLPTGPNRWDVTCRRGERSGRAAAQQDTGPLARLALLLVAYLLGSFRKELGLCPGVPDRACYNRVLHRPERQRSPGLVARYAAFVVLRASSPAATWSDRRRLGYRHPRGCIESNRAVAQLQREEDKQTFCSCFADKMTWPAARMNAAVFITFREPTPIQDDPAMTAVATEAWNQCGARLLPFFDPAPPAALFRAQR